MEEGGGAKRSRAKQMVKNNKLARIMRMGTLLALTGSFISKDNVCMALIPQTQSFSEWDETSTAPLIPAKDDEYVQLDA